MITLSGGRSGAQVSVLIVCLGLIEFFWHASN